jgi:hypothetical protein
MSETTYLAELLVQQNLLSQVYREPSITAYNRLESRPRSQNFERSLRAEVRDALWMLTRQWQMGEFEAEDAGSAIDARVMTRQVQLDRVSRNFTDGENYSDEIPMEALVEREPLTFGTDDLNRTYGLRLKMGQYFLKLHSAALRTKYLSKYFQKFAFHQNRENDFNGQPTGLNLYLATKLRSIDGGEIYKAIRNNSFISEINPDPADNAEIVEISTRFSIWFQRQYNQPSEMAPTAWHPQTLDYQFSTAAPYADGRQKALSAKEYYSGRLDWYSFNESTHPIKLQNEVPPPISYKEEVISFIPTPAEFKGMPNARFWEMEERQIDFGKINAKTTDHLLVLFAEFGLIYGNDWSVIPYKLPVNTLCDVRAMVVTDVFGDRVLIRAANEGDENNWQRWSMFNLSNEETSWTTGKTFFLPSTIIDGLQSDPVEQVNFIRDEMANMVWGIEDIIPGATGLGINGDEAASKEGILPEPVSAEHASIRYVLGTTVPENWIPFMPVQKNNSVQDIYFQRARMPRLGTPPVDTVKAKGVLLNEVPAPYYINEEEIPYSGTIVQRAYQRVRWYDGKTFLWIGRYRQTGRGQGGSNLRFDQIDEIK